jgi:hypothetical protein
MPGGHHKTRAQSNAESTGGGYDELAEWVSPKSVKNLRRTLGGLVHAKRFAHQVGAHYAITRTGQLDVERRKLVEPPP